MAKENNLKENTQERVKNLVKEAVGDIVYKIVKMSTKKAVKELKERLKEKHIHRVENRLMKEVSKQRLDKQLLKNIEQVTKEITKDSVERVDFVRGIERVFENGFKKYLWSIPKGLIPLKTIVITGVLLSVVGGGAFAVLTYHVLTIDFSGEGTIDPGPGTHVYTQDTEITVTAVPAPGWRFDHWGGDVSGSSRTMNITMDSNQRVTAYFVKPTTKRLTISVNGRGTTNPSPGTYTYDEGTQVTITATGFSGWRFTHWVGDISGTSPTITITMDRNKAVTANFEDTYLSPDIRTPINSIDFLDVVVGNSLNKTTTIYNDGNATLMTNSITRTSGSSEFTYIGPPVPFSLGADRSQQVTIRFAPRSEGAKSATFTVSSNDPDEANVTFSVSGNSMPPLLPDLAITTGSPTVTPSTVEPGGTVSLSAWTVKNQGNTNSGSFFNGFYLSTDSVITASDTYLTGNSNSNLAPRAQFNWGSPTLTIPDGTPPGNYYIGILVDRTNVVSESNENNNYVASRITVSAPLVWLSIAVTRSGTGTTDPEPGKYPYPDGFDLSITATPYSGWRFVGWTVEGRNIGLNPITLECNGYILSIYNVTDILMYQFALSNPGNVVIIANFVIQ